MKKTIAISQLLLLLLMVGACKGPSLEKANKLYEDLKFYEAADMYEEVYKKKSDQKVKAKVAMQAAESYRQTDEWRKAQLWYTRAIRMGHNEPEAYYNLGEMYRYQEDFDMAREQFETLLKEHPGNELGKQGLELLDLVEELTDGVTRFNVDVERRLNSTSNDFAPTYYKRSTEALVFTSDREDGVSKKDFGWTGKKFTDLYISNWNKRTERWEKPELLPGEVNSPFNDGVATFNSRGNEIYYTQCNDPDGEGYNCKIMVARKKGQEWGEGEALPFCTDSTVRYGHPSLSPDGKKLFFTSTQEEGGFGGRDIWVSFYVSRSRTWGDPINLGPTINTEKDEMYPYALDDTTLYFASNGHPGLGGLDIFVSYGKAEEWSEPQNLKAPINSTGDDFGIVFNEDQHKGHFSTNRGGRGDNIYNFFIEPLVFTLSGTVYDERTNEPLDSALIDFISINEEGEEEEIYIFTDEEGKYSKDLEVNMTYKLNADKDGYFASDVKTLATIDQPMSKDFVRDFELMRQPTTEIELEGILYDLDEATLRPESIPVLDSLVEILQLNPTIVIELASHTDCRATRQYNQKLSQRRAESVVNYLVDSAGINPERLEAQGYGEDSLLNDCACEDGVGPGLECSEEEHQMNRRTTFRVLRTDFMSEEQKEKEEYIRKRMQELEEEERLRKEEEERIRQEEEERRRLLEEEGEGGGVEREEGLNQDEQRE